ncbi:helix-turn-helix domain-containing protein [Ramlibacter ginsenosidimutans]|uniref:Helix-turn-helix domain-containing protein n=1 Tax=Ramlibacter ginsenosidimutans TaxID=502333 RepID=A0A934TWS2_9BURK|nr:helix-turn-helix domain-containing protein [Ramlibacter ginsenosidimutans]MBK6009104.1 helix-turn-helix domain-containing protein [Ramlibacter ginsenosidimutans]
MSEAAATVDGVTAGTLLRQAREQAGLHVATLAANLKVPVRKLEALEDDQYDQLGDAVFVRALASSICRTLKVDPQPVLQRLPQTASPRLAPEGERINAPFRAPSDGPSPGLLDQLSRPVVLTVMVLLLGALVIVFLPLAQRGYEAVRQAAGPEPASPPAVETPVAEAPQPLEPASGAEPAAQLSAAAPVGVAPAAPAATSIATAARPAASADSSAVAAARLAASEPAAASPQQAASGSVAARGIVTFRTSGPSWVQVTDATGATVLRKLMQAGESAGASGTPPLSVTIGSVAATEVQVRGQPYNLAPVARDNVARFEVK